MWKIGLLFRIFTKTIKCQEKAAVAPFWAIMWKIGLLFIIFRKTINNLWAKLLWLLFGQNWATFWINIWSHWSWDRSRDKHLKMRVELHTGLLLLVSTRKKKIRQAEGWKEKWLRSWTVIKTRPSCKAALRQISSESLRFNPHRRKRRFH